MLIPGQQFSVATLGRRAKAAGEKAGQLLPILDAWARQRVRDAAADELYVNAPVRMVVEQDSLCWLSGQLSAAVDGEGWAQEFRQLPNLEQVARDGGSALAKGVALVNAERQEQGRPLLVDQGDHFHALRGAGGGFRKAERKAIAALGQAEKAQQELEECKQQGRHAHADRRLAVAHCVFDDKAIAISRKSRGNFLCQLAGIHTQRRTFRQLHLLIRLSRLAFAARHDHHVDQKPAQRLRHVDHKTIH